MECLEAAAGRFVTVAYTVSVMLLAVRYGLNLPAASHHSHRVFPMVAQVEAECPAERRS